MSITVPKKPPARLNPNGQAKLPRSSGWRSNAAGLVYDGEPSGFVLEGRHPKLHTIAIYVSAKIMNSS
jgi:hypothetical protein